MMRRSFTLDHSRLLASALSLPLQDLARKLCSGKKADLLNLRNLYPVLILLNVQVCSRAYSVSHDILYSKSIMSLKINRSASIIHTRGEISAY